MAFDSVFLGEFIELVDIRNSDLTYGVDDVRGVNNQKMMIRTKADLSGRDLSKFQVVQPGEFFFNHRTSRNGDKFSVTFNYDEKAHIVTEDYVVFRVVDEEKLNPLWLYLYLCRAEFDRYVIQNSWGSSTEFYNWEDLCQVSLTLPPIKIQRKYSAIYSGILENQRCYERGLEDLKLVCDSFVEKLKGQYPLQRLEAFVSETDVRNGDRLDVDSVKGISTEKRFIPTKANMKGVSLSNYKIVSPGQFAYVADTSRRGEKISLACNDSREDYLVSSISIVFETTEKLLPEYLMLFFGRSEFDRYSRFNSWGSARETFNWEEMIDVRIPVPSISVQRSVADVRKVYLERKRINEKLKEQLSALCSILIKGSLEEAAS